MMKNFDVDVSKYEPDKLKNSKGCIATRIKYEYVECKEEDHKLMGWLCVAILINGTKKGKPHTFRREIEYAPLSKFWEFMRCVERSG